MIKCFVLDTNVLMHDPNSLFSFEDNDVVIPLVVLDELDKHKSGPSQSSAHARMVIRSLDGLRAIGDLSKGVRTEAGGKIRVELNHVNHVPRDLDPSRADNHIISVALGIKKESADDYKVSVVTKDINLRVKCDALSIYAEDYNSDAVIRDADSLYSGSTEISVDSADIDKIHNEGCLGVKNITKPLFPNEYVLLRSVEDNKHTALSRFDGTSLVKVQTHNNVWGISPKNKEQALAFDALFNPDIKLVTITGKSGTGKTLLTVAAAVAQVIDSQIYKRIIMTRPVIPMGKGIGFLPGSMQEKMSPWIAPLRDNLDLIFSDKGRYYLEGLFADNTIEVEPLAYIRGRSIPQSLIIIDESQNLNKHEVKTIITRVGEGSKIILTGDIEQIDTPYIDSYDNGLSYIIEKFKDEQIAAHITMFKGERSELATTAAEKL